MYCEDKARNLSTTQETKMVRLGKVQEFQNPNRTPP